MKHFVGMMSHTYENRTVLSASAACDPLGKTASARPELLWKQGLYSYALCGLPSNSESQNYSLNKMG